MDRNTIELMRKDSEKLLRLYLSEREKIWEQLEPLKKEYDRIENIIADLEANGEQPSSIIESSYNQEWYWWKRAQYVLLQKLAPMTANEILEAIYKLEGEPGSDITRRGNLSALSGDLGRKADEGKIFSRTNKNEENIYKYTLKEWAQR